jgi:hypothetical protein
VLWLVGRGLYPAPAIGELPQDVVSRACKLIAMQRLAVGEATGKRQGLGELGLLDLDAEQADAVAETPTVSALLQRCWRAREHVPSLLRKLLAAEGKQLKKTKGEIALCAGCAHPARRQIAS